MPSITPFLWFDDQAEEAVKFYASVFPDAKVGNVTRLSGTPGPEGKVLVVNFELQGQPFIALNGGPNYKFTEAVSMYIRCDGQEEVDYFWEKLTADGGKEGPCGWLKDKFGLSWQVVPQQMESYLADPDPERAQRATQAMLKMKKLDLAELQKAADGKKEA